MKTGVRIQGGKIEKQAVEAVAKAITTVFDSAFKNHMDQETVRAAISVVSRMGVVEGAHVSSCSFGDGR